MVANFIRKEAEKELAKLIIKPSNIFSFVKLININGKDIQEENGKLRLVKKTKKIWKNHSEEIIKKENNLNHMTDANMLKGLVEKVSREESSPKNNKLMRGSWILGGVQRYLLEVK